MEIREAFATRITNLRKQIGFTQGELAEKLGISRQSVTLYENRSRIPDIEVLRKYADFFGVTSDYLIGLNDNKNVENAATGAKLGLRDSAIDCLKLIKQCGDALQNLSREGILELSEYFALLDISQNKDMFKLYGMPEHSPKTLYWHEKFRKYLGIKQYFKTTFGDEALNDIHEKYESLIEQADIESKIKKYEEKYSDIITNLNSVATKYDIDDLFHVYHTLSHYGVGVRIVIENYDIACLLGEFWHRSFRSREENTKQLKTRAEEEREIFVRLIDKLIELRNDRNFYWEE